MTANDLQALLPSLERFHRRFGRFFVRSEARAWSHKYLIGLTLPIERKNVENIAEQVGAPPRKLQEFLSDSPWDEEGCVEELQGFVGEQMGSAEQRPAGGRADARAPTGTAGTRRTRTAGPVAPPPRCLPRFRDCARNRWPFGQFG